VVNGLRNALAHQAGGTDGVVEARVHAHLEYRGHAAPLLGEQQAEG
jgi:hypothetical protein